MVELVCGSDTNTYCEQDSWHIDGCFESWDPTEQCQPAEPDRKEKDEAVGETSRSRRKNETDCCQNNGYRSNDHPREAEQEHHQESQDADHNWGRN